MRVVSGLMVLFAAMSTMVASSIGVTAVGVEPPLALAPSATTGYAPVVERWGGADRYAVSANISATNFEPGVGTAYVANGLASADALAAGPVAGMSDGPILLVKKDGITADVAAELARLSPARVVVLGGTGSVSAAVESRLRSYTSQVERWDGIDRYAVSANISATTFAPGVGRVYVANGLASADALAAGPVAGMSEGPILLVKKDFIPAPVRDELRRLMPAEIVVLGGTGSVSPAVEASLGSYASTVARWAGADRYEVAAGISNANFATGVSTVYIANGLASADALAAGPVAVRDGGPILLTRKDSVPADVLAELERLNPARIVVLGGLGSVSFRVADELEFGPWPPLSTFGAGTRVVGSQVMPGTYRASGGNSGCYWERLSGFSGELEDIIANDFGNPSSIVTIANGDVAFYSDDCGTWTTVQYTYPSSPSNAMADGTYVVGGHIQAGTYRAPGGDGCYWERLSGFSGDLDDVIANDFEGATVVSILDSDRGFHTDDCGTWSRIG